MTGFAIIRTVPLTQGKYAIVDQADYEMLSRFSWRVAGRRWRYAVTGPRAVSMHRLVMIPDQNSQVDHKNGNGLDNRRCNLRVCTQSQNQSNRGAQSNGSCGFKGVTRQWRGHGWKAQIGANGHRRALGYFASAEEAARAYDSAAREIHGEFARLNFPDEVVS